MARLFLILLLLIPIFTFSQSLSDIDSLSRAIDSSAKANKKVLDSLNRKLDSTYAEVQLRQNSENLNRLLADLKEREKKEQRQTYIRMGFLIILIIIVVLAIIRRRRSRSNSIS